MGEGDSNHSANKPSYEPTGVLKLAISILDGPATFFRGLKRFK